MEFLDKAMRWVRYAYFLRFSLGLWFFAPILCWLNSSSARTLTSGIMTPGNHPAICLCRLFSGVSRFCCTYHGTGGADQRPREMG